MRREGIPYDGFASVLEMLRRSDGAFREKILNNLRRMDPPLARKLEMGLKNSSQSEVDSRAALDRSQRAALTRQYGA